MTEAMTRRTPGRPCWTSLMVHSLAVTQEFYHGLFGWEFSSEPRQLGACVTATLDGQEVAGIGELPAERHLPVAWTTYFSTDDADATAEMIRACGGTVAVGPLDAEDSGRLAIASDPGGTTFGIWQRSGQHGGTATGRPGTPFWHELVTRDTATVEKFYAVVFGCETGVATADKDGSEVTTLLLGGEPVAALRGVGEALSRAEGPRWRAHFEVADVDATARRVTELGGYVLREPWDSATGRIATVADPEGATFMVTRPVR